MWQSIREFFLRAAGIFRTRRLEHELTDELEFHLALKEAKYREKGIAPLDAFYEARRDFGGVERWKERCRDVANISILEDALT